MNNASEVISTKRAFCGAVVHLHADGSVSDRNHFIGRGKLPVAQMWRVWEDVSLYTHAEIPALIRAVRAGKWSAFCVRKPLTEAQAEAILAAQVRRGGFVNGCYHADLSCVRPS